MKVLVVDDNLNHAAGLAELLELNGFESRFASSGCEGVATAIEWAPDAILLDVNLPDISGFDVCQKLRSDPKTKQIAIVFHSGSWTSLWSAYDADAFLTYPVTITEISAVIRGSVMRRKSNMFN